MKNETLHIELLVSSNALKSEQIPDFRIGIKLTNRSDVPVHFDMTETALFVNSKKNMAWDLAVQNGTIINLKVPPAQSKSIQWPLGNDLFEQPGIYNLELRSKTIILKQEITVFE